MSLDPRLQNGIARPRTGLALRSPAGRPRPGSGAGLFSPQGLIGVTLAFYLLVGRWTLSRISTDVDAQVWLEPRLWALILLGVLVLLEQSTRRAAGRLPRVRLGLVATLSLLFLGYMGLSATWAPNAELAGDKAYEMGLMGGLVVLLYLSLQGPHREGIRTAFWQGIVLFTGGMAFLALSQVASDRIAVLGGGPNVFGHNMGLLVIGAFYLSRRYGTSLLWFWWMLAAVGSQLVLLSGSRGAMVALLAAAGAYQFVDRQPLSKKLLLFAGTCLVGAVLVTQTRMGQRAQETFAYRVLHLTVEQRHTSGRDSIYQTAVQTGLDHPTFGIGLNGFRVVAGIYPHNLFLEAFSEGGGCGLGLLVAALLAGGWGLWRIRRTLNGATGAALAASFMAGQFSGDLYDNRGVLLFLCLALIPETAGQVVSRVAPRLRPVLRRASLPRPTFRHPVALPRPPFSPLRPRPLALRPLDVKPRGAGPPPHTSG